MTPEAARLEEATEALRAAWLESGEHWDDDTRRAFRENYLDALLPRLNRAIDAIHRMADVLSKAERECSDV